MFEWLLEDMRQIKTPKFFLTDGPLDSGTRKAMDEADMAIPPSYKEFILKFGNAHLYRRGGVYLVRVNAAPRQIQLENGERLLQLGRTDLALAYFKELLLIRGQESPVFEWRNHQGIRKVTSGFEEWLENACRRARRRFTKEEWKHIQEGPPPFDEREMAIVEARRRFRWRRTGVTQSGDVLFEVHNGSSLVLPYLSLSVRDKQGDLIGGIWVPVSSILPGETKTVQKACYNERFTPNQIEVVQAPDPAPEDRELYWEFRQMPG